MTRTILAAILALSLGCALRFGGPAVEGLGDVPEWTADDCRGWDDAYVGWTIAAGMAGGLGASAGVLLASWPDAPEGVQIGVGAAGGILAAASAAAAGVASFYAQRYSHRCADPILFDDPESEAAPADP